MYASLCELHGQNIIKKQQNILRNVADIEVRAVRYASEPGRPGAELTS